MCYVWRSRVLSGLRPFCSLFLVIFRYFLFEHEHNEECSEGNRPNWQHRRQRRRAAHSAVSNNAPADKAGRCDRQ